MPPPLLLHSTTSGDSATELLRSCLIEAMAARRPACRGPQWAEPDSGPARQTAITGPVSHLAPAAAFSLHKLHAATTATAACQVHQQPYSEFEPHGTPAMAGHSPSTKADKPPSHTIVLFERSGPHPAHLAHDAARHLPLLDRPCAGPQLLWYLHCGLVALLKHWMPGAAADHPAAASEVAPESTA
jgi:hypothetical protein